MENHLQMLSWLVLPSVQCPGVLLHPGPLPAPAQAAAPQSPQEQTQVSLGGFGIFRKAFREAAGGFQSCLCPGEEVPALPKHRVPDGAHRVLLFFPPAISTSRCLQRVCGFRKGWNSLCLHSGGHFRHWKLVFRGKKTFYFFLFLLCPCSVTSV